MLAKYSFIRFGRLGQLLYKRGHDESVRFKSFSAFDKTTGERLMFDRKIGQWIPLDEDIVPWTYTLAPEPNDEYVEVNYFIATGGLIKHKFIWCNSNRLSTNVFEKLKSCTNIENYGRYTLTPYIPVPTADTFRKVQPAS